jgi:hypothetical protein
MGMIQDVILPERSFLRLIASTVTLRLSNNIRRDIRAGEVSAETWAKRNRQNQNASVVAFELEALTLTRVAYLASSR